MSDLLMKQQQDNRIVEMKFNRKFTALFRLYAPLILELHDQPDQLIKTYLMWENSFFNLVHLVHHRDSARTDHMKDIVRLAHAPEEEMSPQIAVFAKKRLDKLDAQRQKTAELAAKKKAKGKAGGEEKKKRIEINWDDDESSAISKYVIGMKRYIAEVHGAMKEAEEAAAAIPKGQKVQSLASEQQHAKKCLGYLRYNVAVLKQKQGLSGGGEVRADDPLLTELHMARKMAPLRLLNILTLCLPNMYGNAADVQTSEQSGARARIEAIAKEKKGLVVEKSQLTGGNEQGQVRAARAFYH